MNTESTAAKENIAVDYLMSKIVQIQAAAQPGDFNSGPHVQLFALCDDGSVWVQYHSSGSSNVPTDGKWYSCHIAAREREATP